MKKNSTRNPFKKLQREINAKMKKSIVLGGGLIGIYDVRDFKKLYFHVEMVLLDSFKWFRKISEAYLKPYKF